MLCCFVNNLGMMTYQNKKKIVLFVLFPIPIGTFNVNV